MKKYRKKPVVIDAVQFDPQKKPWPTCITPWRKEYPDGDTIQVQPRDMSWGYIETLEGNMHVLAGDWIICGVKGEWYPCKPDIFDATYEPVTE